MPTLQVIDRKNGQRVIPIFEGLAVALITGALASTVLTLIVVPGLYFLLRRGSDDASARSPHYGDTP